MTLPPVIHVHPATHGSFGTWRDRTDSVDRTPYVPAAALAEAEARIKELEAEVRGFAAN